MGRKNRHKGFLWAPQAMPRVLIAAVLLIAVLGFASEPNPVEAAVITCPISATSRLPTKTEFAAMVEADVSPEDGDGAASGRWMIWAPLPARCKSLLGKGQYLYRAKWSVRMQLASGWPYGIEYQRASDTEFQTGLYIESKLEPRQNGFTGADLYGDRWDYSGTQLLSRMGRTESFLTELCFAERCSFDIEETGSFGSVSGTAIPIALTFVDMCFRYVPEGAEGAAETVKCRNGYAGRDYYAHPGTFGMQVTASGTMTFEPLWTWRR